MADTQSPPASVDAPGEHVRDDFDQLLDDVRPIADGISGIHDVLRAVMTEDERRRLGVRVQE